MAKKGLGLPGLPRTDRGTIRLPPLPDLPRPPRGVELRVPAGIPNENNAERSQEWRSVPTWFRGTPAQYAIYWAHDHARPRRGRERVDGRWYFMTPLFGNWQIAGWVPGFLEVDVRVVIDIVEQASGQQIDTALYRIRDAILRGFGYEYILIDSGDALDRPVYFLEEALAGRSSSRYRVG